MFIFILLKCLLAQRTKFTYILNDVTGHNVDYTSYDVRLSVYSFLTRNI